MIDYIDVLAQKGFEILPGEIVLVIFHGNDPQRFYILPAHHKEERMNIEAEEKLLADAARRTLKVSILSPSK